MSAVLVCFAIFSYVAGVAWALTRCGVRGCFSRAAGCIWFHHVVSGNTPVNLCRGHISDLWGSRPERQEGL